MATAVEMADISHAQLAVSFFHPFRCKEDVVL